MSEELNAECVRLNLERADADIKLDSTRARLSARKSEVKLLQAALARRNQRDRETIRNLTYAAQLDKQRIAELEARLVELADEHATQLIGAIEQHPDVVSEFREAHEMRQRIAELEARCVELDGENALLSNDNTWLRNEVARLAKKERGDV